MKGTTMVRLIRAAALVVVAFSITCAWAAPPAPDSLWTNPTGVPSGWAWTVRDSSTAGPTGTLFYPLFYDVVDSTARNVVAKSLYLRCEAESCSVRVFLAVDSALVAMGALYARHPDTTQVFALHAGVTRDNHDLFIRGAIYAVRVWTAAGTAVWSAIFD